MSARQLAMRSADDAPLLLERVQVRGSIDATLARITMRQEYRNETTRNVEAIYTFPLPPSAVLLRTVVELAGKRYEGRVVPKAQAEREYEGAIAEGNTAIMVERPEPGLYTMNLGNLMAGESATVEIEFAELLDWSHGRLRLALPMTIAPRYGEERGKLEPHARPHIDILTERAFDLELRIGIGGNVSSPSHSIATGRLGDDLVVSLTRKNAWMDRDFVLLIQSARKPEPFAVVARDGDAHVGYVSFQIPESQSNAAGRDVRIVLDCSGSMAGTSIALARKGAINLLNRLRAEDRFAMVAFGSGTHPFRSSLAGATEINVETAISWIQSLEADMGGTELAQALEAVMAIRGPKGRADIFLVTDGQVGESARTVDRAGQLGHRIFVVGIGVSPSRGLLQDIVDATGGAVDYIAPEEDVAEAIGRQFARITQVPVSEISVHWSADVRSEWRTGIGLANYSGDTIHSFCHLTSGAERSALVRYRVGDAEPVSFEIPCIVATPEVCAALPRIAANQRIRDGLRSGSMENPAAESLAVEHQLVTNLTNYVLAIEREGMRATDMPVATPVRTMLAAGWGGTGQDIGEAMMLSVDYARDSLPRNFLETRLVEYRTPSEHAAQFVRETNDRYGSLLSTAVLPMSLSAVRGMMLPDAISELLVRLVAEGRSMEEVMRAFWAAFGLYLDPSSTKRGLARKLKAASRSADRQLVERILAELRSLESHLAEP